MVQERTKQTELGEIPESWESVILGDVCKTTSGGTPSKNKPEYYVNGVIPWLTSSEVNQGLIYEAKQKITQLGLEDSSAKIFPKNTVLIALYGATAGKVGLLNFESATNQAVCGILPNDSFISKFLYMYLSTKTEEIITFSSGGAQQNISQAIVRSIKILLPPLSEQKKIAAVLSKIQQNINAKEELTKTTTELKRSLMQYLFTYGTKGEKTKRTEIGEIPESWMTPILEDVCKKIKYPDKIKKNAYLKKGKYPIVSQEKELISGYSNNKELLYDQVPIIIFGDHTKCVKYIDFYFCLGADGAKILKPNKEWDCKFFYYATKNLKIRDLGYSRHFKLLKTARIPFPPLPEQKKIASILSKIDERIQNYEAQKSTLQTLFKSMLNKLMTGQIRVHQLDIDVSEIE